jgi:hypothetical protein
MYPVCSKIPLYNILYHGPILPRASSCRHRRISQKSSRMWLTCWICSDKGFPADIKQAVFQAYKYLIIRSTTQHVRISQR